MNDTRHHQIVEASPRVAIVVDNPRRDLRGLVLLAHEFTKLGALAYLVPMYQQGYDLPLLAPDLVVVNYARENNRSLLETYRALHYRVAVLDTEGGVLSESGLDSPANWARGIRQSGLAALVHDYCFWGEAVRDAFVEHSGMDAEALAVTGCPRYDLCCAPWSEVLEYERRGFVLVNTNFSAINPQFTRSAEDESRIFKSLGWEADYVEKLFDELKAVFPRYLDAVELIARTFPAKTVLVRPHPFENPQIYRDRFAGLSNVIVDGAGDILNAIFAADCVVHLNCGSAVDTVRLGKLPISLEYLNTERMRRHAPLPSRLSCPAGDPEMLLSLIADPDAAVAGYDKIMISREVGRWYHLSDGLSARRVATFLMSRLGDRQPAARRSLGAAVRGGRSRASALQVLRGALGALAGSKPVSTLAELVQRSRRQKRIELPFVIGLLEQYCRLDDGVPALASIVRNPLTGAPLSTIAVRKK
ncbi:surface carbohydrate biosynthesis protein [Azospira restricta]|uniref:Surface carbohydrate biosynthesis protein n=1 Tax=Azospira restricta TaxID=404405 RepID=A0A974SPF4_9RHOO|nr:surface carbohydrate biosynthesis protein [Azospira restricta]QRJ64058.1 hypothetical protein IWH25_01480 [Azospira restricta]